MESHLPRMAMEHLSRLFGWTSLFAARKCNSSFVGCLSNHPYVIIGGSLLDRHLCRKSWCQYLFLFQFNYVRQYNEQFLSFHFKNFYSVTQYEIRVFGERLPAVLDPCDQRRHIGWLTTSVDHMNISHVTTDDYYYSRTQCVRNYSNGRGTVTTESAKFYFDTLPKIH